MDTNKITQSMVIQGYNYDDNNHKNLILGLSKQTNNKTQKKT